MIIGVFLCVGNVALGTILHSHTKSVRFGEGGKILHTGMSIGGRFYLHIIRNGALTNRQYMDEILRPIVVPFAAAIGDHFILMNDNCRAHRANSLNDFLLEEGIIRME